MLFCLQYLRVKTNGKLFFRCFKCKSRRVGDFNEILASKFSNTNKFRNGDINTVILLLRKGVYPYK